MRRLFLLSLLVVVLVAAFGAWAGRADAYVEPPLATQPYKTAADADLYTALRATTTTTDMTAFEATFAGEGAAGAEGAMVAAEGAAVMPALATMGTIAAVPAAGYLGWKIGGAIYQKVWGSGTPPDSGLRWNYRSAYSNGNFTTAPSSGWEITTAPGGWEFYCMPYTCGFPASALNTFMSDATGTEYAQTYSGTGPCGTAGPSCKIKWRTTAQMRAATRVAPITAAQYAALPSSAQTATSFTEPSHTSADATAARAYLDSAPHEARDYVNWTINHSYAPMPETATIPAPTIHETATAYRARLITLGFLGTITITVVDPAVEGYGANVPVRVQATQHATGLLRTLDPHAWPGTAPTVDSGPSSSVSIQANPSTAVEPADPPGGGGGGGSIDFSPLTSLDPGCKFPYGLFCYAQDVTGWFNVAPDAPSFHFTFASLGGHAISGGGHYDVDLSDVAGLDTYMGWWRTLLSIALWVGAVWMLASRLLGLNLGDPGEAMDD